MSSDLVDFLKGLGTGIALGIIIFAALKANKKI
jgi:hypothetical protein